MISASSTPRDRGGEGEGILAFVETESPSRLLKMAKRAAKAAGISTASVCAKSVVTEMFDRQWVFVCDEIQSEVSKHLLDNKRKVIGPSVVCWCLKQEQALPNAHSLVYCMTMSSIHVSCSSLEQTERDRMYELVTMMGGAASKNLTSDVTHLVAGAVGSKKYRTAVRLGLAIMSTEWIMKCWEESQTRIISAFDDEFAVMKCPALAGCCICVTGLDNRQEVKIIIEENGGVYSGELDMEKCSHLVAKQARGMKYEYAVKWRLFVVSPSWLYDSVRQGVCLDEQSYTVDQEVMKGDVEGRSDCDTNAPKNGGACVDVMPEVLVENVQNLQMDVSNLYLDGCKILIRSEDKSNADVLRQIVNVGGGIRCHDISDSVTHFVTDKLTEQDCQGLDVAKSLPYIVSSDWLIACCENKERVTEERYLLKANTMLPNNDMVKYVTPAVDCLTSCVSPAASNDDKESNDIMDGYLWPCADINQQGKVSPAEFSGPLGGKSFAVADVATGQENELSRQIVLHGGLIVEAGTADVLIVSIDSSVSCHHDRQQLCTPFWLSRCIESGQFLDYSLHPLYRPIPIAASVNPFSGLVFCISQFMDLERDVLIHFIRLLGGTVQQQMLRRDRDDLKKTNFLVLKEAAGAKYEASKLWSVPAVSPKWMYECARRQSLVEVEPFLVDERQASGETCVSKDSIPSEMKQEGIEGKKTRACGRKSLGTALSLLGDNIKPQFDTADAMQGLNSSTSLTAGVHSGHSADGSLLGSAFQHNMEIAIGQLVHPPGEGGTKEAHTTETGPSTCLSGVVLFVTKKLAKQQTILHDMAALLGGDYRFTYDESCTHVIHEGRWKAGSKEMKLAKDNNNFIVSPYWLHACCEAASHLDEASFPHTYNPRMSLTGICTRRQSRSVKEEGEHSICAHKSNQLLDRSQQMISTQTFGEQSEMDLTDVDRGEGSVTSSNAQEVQGASEDREDFKRQIDELVTAARNRRSSSRRKSQQTVSVSKADRQPTGSAMETRSSCQHHDDSSGAAWRESMSMATIGYDDPSGREERERIIAQIEETVMEAKERNTEGKFETDRGGQSRPYRLRSLPASQQANVLRSAGSVSSPLAAIHSPQRLTRNSTTSSKECQLTPTPPAPPPIAVPIRPPAKTNSPLDCSLLLSQRVSSGHVRVFQLSGLDRDEKMDYSALIESLGGKFYDYDHYVTSTSHLVAGKASRTEKFMAMVAAGKWVLHKSYLEASRQAGTFVDEEEHEWGRIVRGSEKPSELAKAARRWRIKLV